jgi:hypothetical protein
MNHRTNSFAACTALVLIAPLPVGSARAEIKTQVIEYKQGDTVLEGFLAYDDAVQGKRPAVFGRPHLDWRRRFHTRAHDGTR